MTSDLVLAKRMLDKQMEELPKDIFFCKNCIIDYQEVIAIDTQLLFGM